MKLGLIRMCVVAALLAPMAAYAQTCTNVATGNWGTPATWNCTVAPAARVPANTDNVVIINNTTVTVNIAGAVAGSVTINTGANATSLTLGAAGDLTVTNAGGLSGNIVINSPTAGVTKQVNVGARPLSVTGSVTINGGTTTASANNIAQLAVTTGTVNIGGNLVMTGGTVQSFARTTLTTGTINVTGNVTLTGGAANNRDAQINITGASAVGAGVNVNGTLDINSTVAASSLVTLGTGSRMRVTGAVTNNDTLTIGAGIFTAQSTLSTGSAANAIAATTAVTTGTLSITGNTTVTSGTNGLKTMSLTNGTITIGGNLDVTAAAATVDTGDATASITGTGTMNITGNATVTGGTTAARDALLTVSGVSGVGAGVNIGGGLTIASTIAGSSTVSLTNASSRMTVSGAAGVINNDTMTVGVGIFGITNAGASLTIGSGASAIAATTSVTTGSLTVAGNAIVDSRTNGLKTLTLGNGTISITGSLSVTAAAATADTGDATASVTGTGTMNIGGNATVTGGTTAARDAQLTVSGVSGVGAGVNISGGLTIASTIAGSSTVSLTNASSRMTVSGAAGVTNDDTMTVGVGIFNISNAAATLTIGSGASAIAATTAVTTGSLTVAGNVVVDSRTNGLKTLSLTNGTISITGNLSVTAAAATADTGDATASVTGTGTMNVGGNAALTGGSNANRDALLTVSGVSAVGAGINIAGSLTSTATVAGSATVTLTNASSRMVVSGAGGVSNGDTVAVGVGIFSMTNAGATYTNSNAAILATTSVSTGSIALTGALSNATGETVAVTGAGSLTVSGALTNAGTMTIATTSTVNANGNFSNSGTVTVTGNGQLFLRGATSTINGTFTRGTGTVTMNGSVAQALSGTALEPVTTAGDGFHNFTINNAAGVTLGSNVVARNVITLTSGEVGTGANVLVSELSCATPSVSRTSGHIVGNFQKLIPAGGSTCNYEIGSAGAYTPASLTFTGVTAGRLIATTVAGDHPNIATSGFTVTRTVNRYWRLTTTGVTGVALTTFTNYSATLTFINPGDLDVGVDPALFDIRRWNGAIWSNVTTGTRTATSTQGTGITALGDLQIGEGTPPAPSSFNAFETSTGAGLITGVIRTKRAGVAFSLDVVAILSGAQHAAFVDPVIVDLLGNNTLGVALDANNCPTSFTVVQTVGPNPSITGGRATVNFTAVANSWRDVRVRVRWPTGSPTVTSCSTDNFAIRPDAIGSFAATNATRTTAGITNPLDSTVFGATVHNAGRPFSFRARAVNASLVDTTNYTGSPLATLTTCVGAACTATQAGLTFTTTFAAGLLATDTASYPDVGSFSLQLTDDDFASVDASDGSTLGERRIASAVINVGRFTPDNFAVVTNVPVFAPACTGFTYQGQAFNYSTPPVITVTAREAGGATTSRYTGSWWRLTNNTLTPAPPALQSARYTAMSGALDTSALPATTADPAIVDSGNGSGTLTFSGGATGFRFTRAPGAPSAEFNAEIGLSLNVIDADSVVFASNPVAFGAATAGNGILFSDANALTTNDKRVRYGRLRLGSTSGSQVLSLRVPVEAQYWNGTSFITNTLDSCTTLVAGNVGLGNYTGNLGAGETTATITTSPLKDGRSAIQLSAPGAANFGGVDVTLNLGAGANADACNSFAPAATAGNLAHLRGLWCAPPGTYSKDPAVRVRFGVVRSSDQSIYRREQ